MTRELRSSGLGAANAETQAAIAALETESPAACPQCGSTTPWGRASWCPDCGYYPKFNIRPSVDAVTTGQATAPATTLIEAIPGWAWTLGAGAIAVAIFSVAATLALPPEGPVRAWFALAQCAIGLIAIGIAQIAVFMKALSLTDRVGPLDVVLKPVAIWKPTFDALPEGAWRVWSAGWGTMAILCAVTLIGGIRWSALFDDWGVKTPPKRNLVQAISEQARQKGSGADSLTDALNEVKGDEQLDERKKLQLQPIDCLVIGYTKLGPDDFSELFVASDVEGQLKYVGRIPASAIPEEERAILRQRLPALTAERSFVDGPESATWLEPVLLCRLRFAEWTPKRLLKEPKFDSLLADAPRP